MKTNKKVIAIVGATASGKTAYSIELAKKIDGEIISADSRLVYKDMNIGTAKPTAQEMSAIPHHMIDLVNPDFEYSAGLYKKEATDIIKKILLKGKTPIIVGGTGLYIDILLNNFSMPEIPPNRNLRNELEKLQTDDLYEILLKKDQSAEKIIHKNDRKKVIRAIEIINETGKSLKDSRSVEDQEFDIQWIGRNFERKELYKRIESRVDLMIKQGLVEETKALINKYGRVYNIINTIGYKEILEFIDGKCSLEESCIMLKQHTRNYAKRQLTWFRKNENIEWNVFPEKLEK